MPSVSNLALQNFVEVNPHWRGAHWSDVLDTLRDSDANLDVTEPEYEYHEGKLPPEALKFVTLVTLTLYWAHPTVPVNHGRVASWSRMLSMHKE
jgi:hypothetical protein